MCGEQLLYVLPKVNKPLVLNDLRPISKILERAVYEQLYRYVSICAGKGSATALLHVNDLIVQGLDNDLATVLIMLDYSKAFNCVYHTLLNAILHYFGLVDRALLFFCCYLEDWKQVVRSHSTSILWSLKCLRDLFLDHFFLYCILLS